MSVKVLPEEVAAKIAAGEVIERPSSVLKELIENSLDAGAARVSVSAEKAGKALIRVNDDGAGMTPEDLRLSVMRHSTSKIVSFEDLDALDTYGFRGEALFSALAVSRLKITTCRAGDEAASFIEGDSGGLRAEGRAAPARGTTVEVRDLFFNVPARLKFLRSDTSERAHLIRVVEEAALANPGVSFSLEVDGAEIFSLKADAGPWESACLARARELLGGRVAAGLTALELRAGELSLRALFSLPDSLYATRQNQFFFVNRRPVSSKTLQQALYRGYDIMRGSKHPACAVYLDLPPAEVDVNIHPRKADVKFREEGAIFKFVSGAVNARLLKAQRASVALEPGAIPAPAAQPAGEQRAVFGTGIPPAKAADEASLTDDLFAAEPAPGASGPSWYQPPVNYLGQLAKSYLVFESGGGLLVVDQHAAQERILFERYMDELTAGTIRVQPLVIPLSVELSASQAENIMRWQDWLKGAGFEIGRSGPTHMLLHATPALFYFSQEAAQELFGYLSEVLGEPSRSDEALKRGTIATMACKKSVKARDFLKAQEAVRLIEDLKAAKDSFHCPHGRPTLFHIGRPELARRFQRTTVI
ncbi:MAG: DNA mismatch repair protein MutL [Elusimicrobia bacterium]|nr:MAG: DNA mismatch repair protein MutL [Elusimicrobiota bacterium]KAF0154644.1 MAG: DNA mismatch repair protein MutL [Elusimicrobiota bacterium]